MADLEAMYRARTARLNKLEERVERLPPMSLPTTFREEVKAILMALIQEHR